MLQDRSPLVRSAAVDALALYPTRGNLQALVKATGDDYRLVHIRAAAGLAGWTKLALSEVDRKNVEKATREYLHSIKIPPDHWASYYNEGNYYLNVGNYRQAITGYETSLRLEPRGVMSRVNMSIAYARLGENKKAETSLREALKVSPDNAAANFNMGLLKAEQKDLKVAERHLKKAIKADPQMAQAAYNLCIITSKDRINEAVTWCRKASDLRPQDPKYAYTLAFYLNQKGNRDEAVRMLKTLIEKYPQYKDAEMLLKDIGKK
jgi:tetratricopeptide (TPR) repeat protein